MKITRITEAAPDQVLRTNFDAIIVASGYESRAIAIAKDIKKSSLSAVRLAWAFQEFADDPVRKKNDKAFAKMGFSSKLVNSGDLDWPEQCVSGLLGENDEDRLYLLIDISSMSRTWYGGIIRALSKNRRAMPVTTIFGYTPAIWSEPKHSVPANEIVEPISGYSSHALPNKPTALLMGLGQDDDRALGLNDYLDPRTTVCFYASPAADPRYENAVLKANADLVTNIGTHRLFTYDLFDTFGTYRKLESVCHGLSRDYCVVLASLGPKIFALYCFLLQLSIEDISVWRVSPATRQTPVDRKSSASRIFCVIEWSGE